MKQYMLLLHREKGERGEVLILTIIISKASPWVLAHANHHIKGFGTCHKPHQRLHFSPYPNPSNPPSILTPIFIFNIYSTFYFWHGLYIHFCILTSTNTRRPIQNFHQCLSKMFAKYPNQPCEMSFCEIQACFKN